MPDLNFGPMSSELEFIIVGGGATGIGAARRLAAKGKAALLLEALSRLGGCAFTQDLGGPAQPRLRVAPFE
ncbi:NAD(P)-binding protein [Methylorubrum populi]|uniref:NAD(P)-binding protein n=1 Tax=Methylorubrum populi TaxID=223967 RepID=UPI003F65F319